MISKYWKPSEDIRRQLDIHARWISEPLADRLQSLTENSDSNSFVENFISVLYLSTSAAHTDFVSQSRRYSSFPPEDDWIEIGNGSSVTEFVEAGFFAAESGSDHVKCFFCNLGLKDWSVGDDPCLEHVKFAPFCFYMKSSRGLQYLQEVVAHRSQPVTFPTVYRLSDHGGLLDKIMDLWKSDSVVAVQSAGLAPNDVLNYICRVWIRERRSNPTQKMVEDLQEASSGSYLDLTQIAEDYYTFHRNRNAVGARSSSSSSSSITQAPKVRIAEERQRKNAAAPSTRRSKASQQENEDESDCESVYNSMLSKRLCKICQENEFNMTCLPCTHLCMCNKCAKNNKKCPVCNHAVTAIVRTYIT